MNKPEWKVNHKEGVIQVGTTDKPNIAWVTDEVNAKFIAQACNNWNSTAKLRGDVEVAVEALENTRDWFEQELGEWIAVDISQCTTQMASMKVQLNEIEQTIARIKGEK